MKTILRCSDGTKFYLGRWCRVMRLFFSTPGSLVIEFSPYLVLWCSLRDRELEFSVCNLLVAMETSVELYKPFWDSVNRLLVSSYREKISYWKPLLRSNTINGLIIVLGCHPLCSKIRLQTHLETPIPKTSRSIWSTEHTIATTGFLKRFKRI